MKMENEGKSVITFLGTGTSTGVPQLGCSCRVCRSTDPHDHRLRCSSLIETRGESILVDCGPDFREQMLSLNNFGQLSAVLITHEHYDHVGGLDDLRPYSSKQPILIYAEQNVGDRLRERLPYCFRPTSVRGLPHLELHTVVPHDTFNIGRASVTPLRVVHGRNEILGFRIGELVYITDMKSIPDSEMEYIRGANLLVVNALRHTPHPTHQTLEEAVAFARATGIGRTYFIHMSHDMGLHAEEDARLPEGLHLAHDGLRVEY